MLRRRKSTETRLFKFKSVLNLIFAILIFAVLALVLIFEFFYQAEEKSISGKKEGSSEEGNLISADKKKRKRGKKGAKDLRFLDLEVAGGHRRQKRKE